MPRKFVLIAIVALVGFGVASRLLPHALNFTPVLAIALFASFLFRTGPTAWLVPLAVMAISDLIIGGYEYGVMISVYASMLAIVAIGRLSFRNRASITTVGAASLAGAVLFFLVTNFAVWLFKDLYPATLEGLMASYTAALPFFRNTLAGTIFWSAVLFGGYHLAGKYFAGKDAARAA